MKRIIALVTLFLLCVGFLAFAQGTETRQIPVEVSPLIKMAVGNDVATLPAYRYPRFDSAVGDNPNCFPYLKSISLKPLSKVVPAFSKLSGLDLEIPVPDSFRTSASILVTWTVRVEAESVLAKVWPDLCSPWHGTVNESFPGGEVYTAIKVNGVLKEPAAAITVPDGKPGTVVIVSDPTNTGSYLIKPEDFSENKLPETVKIQVWWKNDTCMKIISKAKYRTVIATFVP